MHQQFTPQQTVEQIFLNGRPPMPEFLGFVTAMTVEGATADLSSLASSWRLANDRVRELEVEEAGHADDVAVEPLPEPLEALASAALAHPIVQHTYALMPISIGMVPLDSVVVHQKKINLAQVDRIKTLLGDEPTLEEIFRVCFPLNRSLDPPFGAQQGGNGWTFVSPSDDFRFLGSKLLPPDAVVGADFNGVPTAVMVMAVGYGSNVLSVARIDRRLILQNGSHRAYALRDLGVSYVPCLIQEISRRDELDVLGIDELNVRPAAYLDDPRPPLLKDYFDERLRIVARTPVLHRHVQVAFNPNALDLPAAPQ
jgi:hypothetical protein